VEKKQSSLGPWCLGVFVRAKFAPLRSGGSVSYDSHQDTKAPRSTAQAELDEARPTSTPNPPRRKPPIFARPEQADLVARRIVEAGFSPAPAFVLRHLLESQAFSG
jgi:hypothetical protein